MICALDTSNIEVQNRPEAILYSCSKFIIYRQENKIVAASCAGEILSHIRLPVDYLKYEIIASDNYIVLLFKGSDLIFIDINNFSMKHHKLHQLKIGTCITPIFQGIDESNIVFGTKCLDRIQFVNYDFINQTRISQTASWKVSEISSVGVTPSCFLYAVLDNSSICVYDMKTGENIITRFETAKINRGIAFQDNKVFYTCNGLIKSVDQTSINTIRIPFVDVSTLEYQDDHNIYISCNGTNLCCYYLPSQTVKWNVVGKYPILESIKIKSLDHTDLMIVRTEQYLFIINLALGKVESSIRIPNMSKIRTTGDHILINKTMGTTAIIAGVEHENN